MKSIVFALMAFILFESCFLSKKTPEKYMELAKKAYDKKDYTKSCKHYTSAINLNAQLYQAYWERGLVNIKMDSLERAIDDIGIYIESMRVKEGVADKKLLEKALMQRAEIMLKRGYKSDACSDWNDACELNISNAPCDQLRFKCK